MLIFEVEKTGRRLQAAVTCGTCGRRVGVEYELTGAAAAALSIVGGGREFQAPGVYTCEPCTEIPPENESTKRPSRLPEGREQNGE